MRKNCSTEMFNNFLGRTVSSIHRHHEISRSLYLHNSALNVFKWTGCDTEAEVPINDRQMMDLDKPVATAAMVRRVHAVKTLTYTQHNDVAFYESLQRNCLNVLPFQVVERVRYSSELLQLVNTQSCKSIKCTVCKVKTLQLICSES